MPFSNYGFWFLIFILSFFLFFVCNPSYSLRYEMAQGGIKEIPPNLEDIKVVLPLRVGNDLHTIGFKFNIIKKTIDLFIYYQSDKPFYIEAIIFKIDGKIKRFNIHYENRIRKVVGIERSELVNVTANMMLIKKIAWAKEVIVRFEGSYKFYDNTLSVDNQFIVKEFLRQWTVK